jgi:hypothetical protein
VAQADPSAAQAALARQRRHLSNGKWLAFSNRYRDYPSERITKDLKAGSTNARDLSGFVAASACTHLADGWAYLGRALDAHAHNDLDASRHAAYYAELRAAISLLSTQGIGIFNKTHVVLTAKGCTSQGGASTHEMVWEALVYWADRPASSPGAARLFGRTIQPYGVPLDNWFVGLPFGKPWKPVASRWLQQWGADLGWFVKDRSARNVASYAANQVRSPAMASTKRVSEVLRVMWLAFEPAPGRPFNKLDLHLLRRSVDAMFKSARSGVASVTNPPFVEMVKAVAANAPTQEQGSHVERFLLRQVDSGDLPILNEADGRLKVYDPGHHVQVMARAAVLLRLATGACSDLIQQAGFLTQDIAKWRAAFAVDRGLWDPGTVPTDPADLWADVQTAMEDLERWESSSPADVTLFDWRTKLAQAVETLTVTDRLLAWGL